MLFSRVLCCLCYVAVAFAYPLEEGFDDALFDDVAPLQILVIGDWGYSDEPNPDLDEAQHRVADAMDAWAAENNPQFILTVGDNFYPEGVQSVDDPWFETKWKLIYTGSHIRDLVWYITLGNHDYYPYEDRVSDEWGGRELFQVKRTEVDDKWYCPDLYHRFTMPSPAGDVEFFIIDTQALRQHFNNHTLQEEWIQREIPASTAPVRIVVGHHPVYTVGGYGPIASGTIYDEVESVIVPAGVDVYLAGHDHNLQHLKRSNGTGPDYFIVGGGGASLYGFNPVAQAAITSWGFDNVYYEAHGFGVITVYDSNITMSLFNGRGALLDEKVRLLNGTSPSDMF